VQGALECLEDIGWIRADAVRACDRHERSHRVPPEASESPEVAPV